MFTLWWIPRQGPSRLHAKAKKCYFSDIFHYRQRNLSIERNHVWHARVCVVCWAVWGAYMGLCDRSHVSFNIFEIALDANLCEDLPALSTRTLALKSPGKRCAVTSPRRLACLAVWWACMGVVRSPSHFVEFLLNCTGCKFLRRFTCAFNTHSYA